MNALPLISGYRPQAPLLVSTRGPLSQARFVGQATALAQSLPQAGFVLNLCDSRLAFLLGFAAALLRGQTSLLPPNKTAATVAAIRARYPDSYVLSDDAAMTQALPVPLDLACDDWPGPPPLIAAEHVAALPFTSGSTGEPLPHAKSWGGLVTHAGLLSQRLGFKGAHLAATVPPQHTYGLETTVLAALAGGAVSHCARPFFPQDLSTVLGSLPAPRLLITTPVHLHALVQARLRMPPLAGIVSATAPLSPELAAAAEEWLAAPLHEIYGSTESGAIATRRTTAGEQWQPLPGVSVSGDEDGAHGTWPARTWPSAGAVGRPGRNPRGWPPAPAGPQRRHAQGGRQAHVPGRTESPAAGHSRSGGRRGVPARRIGSSAAVRFVPPPWWWRRP